MALKIEQIRFEAKLPNIPDTVAAVQVQAPSLEDRNPGMKALAGMLGVGRTRAVETEFSQLWAGAKGDVEYFHNSGGVWSRDLTAAKAYENELREWPDMEKAKDEDGNVVIRLGRAGQRSVMEKAREAVDKAGFDMKHVSGEAIALTQVSELSEEGRTLRQGAGEATVIFQHSLEGMKVLGAGAKTSLEFQPEDKAVRLVGALQVWRQPKATHKIAVGGTEAAIAAGLLGDADLIQAAEKGGQITVTELEFGLMALPAHVRQDIIFPVLRVAGRVTLKDDKLGHYEFGRYCHAARSAAYVKAGLAAGYLARPN